MKESHTHKNKKEMTLDHGCKPTVKGHFCSLLVSNIICLSSLSTVCLLSSCYAPRTQIFFSLQWEFTCCCLLASAQKANLFGIFQQRHLSPIDLNTLFLSLRDSFLESPINLAPDSNLPTHTLTAFVMNPDLTCTSVCTSFLLCAYSIAQKIPNYNWQVVKTSQLFFV